MPQVFTEIIDHLLRRCLFAVHIYGTSWCLLLTWTSRNYHRPQTFFGPIGDTHLFLNGTWFNEIYRRLLSFERFGGNTTMVSLIIQQDHPIKIFTFVLLSFLIGLISSQAEQGTWHGWQWTKQWRTRPLTLTRRILRAGGMTQSKDIWLKAARSPHFWFSY